MTPKADSGVDGTTIRGRSRQDWCMSVWTDYLQQVAEVGGWQYLFFFLIYFFNLCTAVCNLSRRPACERGSVEELVGDQELTQTAEAIDLNSQ